MKKNYLFVQLALSLAVIFGLTTIQAVGSPTQPEKSQGATLVGVNPFAGAYCGFIGNLSGTITVSNGGKVSGFFQFWSPNYNDTLTFTGTVTDAGIMRVKAVRTISVRDRRSGISTSRYSAELVVALDENGNLIGTSGWATPFVLPPCQ